MDDPVLERASAFEDATLRALDAVHLATALSLGDDPIAKAGPRGWANAVLSRRDSGRGAVIRSVVRCRPRTLYGRPAAGRRDLT